MSIDLRRETLRHSFDDNAKAFWESQGFRVPSPRDRQVYQRDNDFNLGEIISVEELRVIFAIICVALIVLNLRGIMFTFANVSAIQTKFVVATNVRGSTQFVVNEPGR